MLGKAGLYDDARRIYVRLYNATGNEQRRKILLHKMGELDRQSSL